jgi:hypothetical protein
VKLRFLNLGISKERLNLESSCTSPPSPTNGILGSRSRLRRPRWDHAFVGDLIEKDLPSNKAKDLCSELGNGKAEACAGVGTYTTGEKAGRRICIIVIASDDLHGALELYRRHEIAHCNGWNKSHSN